MPDTPATIPIPDHVPEALIEKDFPIVRGRFTQENPFDRIIPEACEGPDIVFVPHMMKGGLGHSWVLRRYEDIQHVNHDVEHFSSHDFSGLSRLIGEDWSWVPAEFDPPEHTFYRRLLSPLYSPATLSKMDGAVRQCAKDTLAPLADKKACDFVKDFAFPFPVGVALDLLGLPRSRLQDFGSWVDMIMESNDIETITLGIQSAVDYLRETIEQRKVAPADDYLSFAIAAEIKGRKLNDRELIGYAFNLFIGAVDTVASGISNMVRHLACNLEHQRELRANPEKIPDAIEEFLRVFAAVTTARTCIKETTIRGVTFKPEDRVSLVTALAGRDKAVYTKPHEVQLDRKPRHMSFGVGPHNCLGMHLARRELRMAIEETFNAIPEFRINPDIPIRTHHGVVIKPHNLPLMWD